MRSKFQASCLVALISVLSWSGVASAMPPGSDPAAAPAGTNPEPIVYTTAPTNPEPVVYTTAPTPPPTQLAAPMDGPRFRYGIAGGVGGEFVAGLSALMYGADLRLGVQINRLVGVYVQQYLAFGKFSDGLNVGPLMGTYIATAMVDFTFFDHVVAGAGLGLGVLQSASGPALTFRAAYYPITTVAPGSVRRKGLMLGLDVRTVFAGAGVNGVVVTGAIGYEAF